MKDLMEKIYLMCFDGNKYMFDYLYRVKYGKRMFRKYLLALFVGYIIGKL